MIYDMNILKKIGLYDKRIMIIYIIVFVFLITGITYALQTTSFAFNTDTAIINTGFQTDGEKMAGRFEWSRKKE